MSILHRPRSVRFRLTLVYAGAMVVVLAVYAALIFYFVRNNMSQFLDNQLKSDFDWALDMMHHDPHGEVIPSDYQENRRRRQSVVAGSQSHWGIGFSLAGSLAPSFARCEKTCLRVGRKNRSYREIESAVADHERQVDVWWARTRRASGPPGDSDSG
jgi:hypothetical protein